MTIHDTPEEEAFGRLLDEKVPALSDAARTVLGQAKSAAYGEHLIYSYYLEPEEYEEAMNRMRLAATELTGPDRESLAAIVQAGMIAASSIDPNDERPVGYKVDQGDYRRYLEMIFGMVDDVLQQ